jgi:hypothetical protein
MTREELLLVLAGLADDEDPEHAHVQADMLLLSYIDDADITQAFMAIKRWYA